MSSPLRHEYLAALGLRTWTLRNRPGTESEASLASAVTLTVPSPEPSSGSLPPPREDAADWAELRARVAACTRCSLSATRTQTVFGVGNLQADWLIVGEAPGAEEDRKGEPFVGRAGLLLNSMLRAVGVARGQVYIANRL